VDKTLIEYEVSDRIATITLNRPEAANAQNFELLDELDGAWRQAADDPDVRVIVLQANGKHFSAGHDIKGVGEGEPVKYTVAGIYEVEARRYLEYALRWRNVPKPRSPPSMVSVSAVDCFCAGLRPDHRGGQRHVLRPRRQHGDRRSRVPRSYVGVGST